MGVNGGEGETTKDSKYTKVGERKGERVVAVKGSGEWRVESGAGKGNTDLR